MESRLLVVMESPTHLRPVDVQMRHFSTDSLSSSQNYKSAELSDERVRAFAKQLADKVDQAEMAQWPTEALVDVAQIARSASISFF